MTLELTDQGKTVCFVKTWNNRNVNIWNKKWDVTLPVGAILEIAAYTIENTDLLPDDPRIAFVEYVKTMHKAAGFNPGAERLVSVDVPMMSQGEMVSAVEAMKGKYAHKPWYCRVWSWVRGER
jgi:hypothetical protein